MSDLSWLNPTPHAIAVYASRPPSPVATQHSLPSGRYSLLGPDFHRLDRTSFTWRTHSIRSSARAMSVGCSPNQTSRRRPLSRRDGSELRRFIGKGRHDFVRETTQALARTTAAHDHVFDAVSTQGFEFAHDLVWRADQAVRLRFLGRMTIGQDMRTSGTVRPERY